MFCIIPTRGLHMNISDMQCGKAGEYLVCADLILQGYVAFPSEQGLPFDVVCGVGKRLVKIQVKTTREPLLVPQRKNEQRGYLFHVKRCGKRGKGVYLDGAIDVFALVALDTRKIAYLHCSDVRTTMSFRSYEREYQGEDKAALMEKCIMLRKDGKTLKQIAEETGKHFTYVQRLLAGKEDRVKFGRYLHDFPFNKAHKLD